MRWSISQMQASAVEFQRRLNTPVPWRVLKVDSDQRKAVTRVSAGHRLHTVVQILVLAVEDVECDFRASWVGAIEVLGDEGVASRGAGRFGLRRW
jgi:hypothetical protein